LDEGENDITAAVRETQEEAGLYENKDYEILSKTITIESKYFIKDVAKRVLYWLARVKDSNVLIKMSEEHQDFKWLKLSDACEIVKYDEMKRVLNLAEDYIIKNDKL
jgi:bis(5'-nucleosidyl)-tetraphosphatase